MSSPVPGLPTPFPVIAGYWSNFEYQDGGHIFHDVLGTEAMSIVTNTINEAFSLNNIYSPTRGYYVTWDRVGASDAVSEVLHAISQTWCLVEIVSC